MLLMVEGRVAIVMIIVDHAQIQVLYGVNIVVNDPRWRMVTIVWLIFEVNTASVVVFLQGPTGDVILNTGPCRRLVQIGRTLREVAQILIHALRCLVARTLLHHLTHVHRVTAGWLGHNQTVDRCHIVRLGGALDIVASRVQVLEH